jgi:hypothetical protein
MAKCKTLPYSDFMGRIGWQVYEQGNGNTEPPLALSQVPELRILAEAALHNCPSAYSTFLQHWLRRIDLKPPDGVFKPIRYGTRGRKPDAEGDGIYLLWVAIGKPSLSSKKLATAHFGSARYAIAKPDKRKQMIDQLRQAVLRIEERSRCQGKRSGPSALTPPGHAADD